MKLWKDLAFEQRKKNVGFMNTKISFSKLASVQSCLPTALSLDDRMEIYPEMSEILAESIRVVGALLRLAGNSEQLFPGIRQAAACSADFHDFLKLDQLEIIEPLGIVGSEQVRKVCLRFDWTGSSGSGQLFTNCFKVNATTGGQRRHADNHCIEVAEVAAPVRGRVQRVLKETLLRLGIERDMLSAFLRKTGEFVFEIRFDVLATIRKPRQGKVPQVNASEQISWNIQTSTACNVVNDDWDSNL